MHVMVIYLKKSLYMHLYKVMTDENEPINDIDIYNHPILGYGSIRSMCKEAK